MDFLTYSLPSPLHELSDDTTSRAGVRLFLKRDDLIHPAVSGNKWRKLKYNLMEAQRRGCHSLLTFGGAFSNHLYAVAAAGKATGIATIGIVRGDELTPDSSSTLRFCREQGMQLYFVSREGYRLKEESSFVKGLLNKAGGIYIMPEGGSNQLALPGVRETVEEAEQQLGNLPEFMAVAAGTGGTAAGLLTAGANVLAFAVLKGGQFQESEIRTLVGKEAYAGQLQVLTDYHFGGYARYTPELITFIQQFEKQHAIRIEQVYTGKMLFGLYDLMKKGFFKSGVKIVALHTGGLQGRLALLDEEIN